MQFNSIFNHLRVVICLSLLIFSVNLLRSQEIQTNTTDESSVLLTQDTEDLYSLDTQQETSKNSYTKSLLKVIFSLLLVVAGIYFAFYLIKKNDSKTNLVDPFIKNPSQFYFSPNKSVQIVIVGDRAFLLGVTDQSINLISEIEDKELIDNLKLEDNKASEISGQNFTDVILNIMKLKPKKEENSANFINADGIKEQRNRLQNELRNQ